jgi:hypothetical protein
MRIKIHPLTAILSSAYLSAMLTSTIAPVRTNATLAAAVDPMAAQKALQNAISGLDVAGWAAAVQTPSAAVTVPVNPPPGAIANEPITIEELISRLIAFTKSERTSAKLGRATAKTLGLNDGTTDIPLLQVGETLPEGDHYFAFSTVAGSRDIFIAFKTADKSLSNVYLTDRSGVLRAAAIIEPSGSRLITNEQAAEKYKAELQLFAKLAKDLPPAGPAVAGNS